MNKICFSAAAFALLALAGGPPEAYAGAVDMAAAFQATTFPAHDDGATGAISLGFSANFFGTTYTDAFVSNNGYLTFNHGQATYTPSGLGASYSGQPIIAPFFADVDTRGSGSGLTSYGTGTYAGHNAFGATWPSVGYFPSGTDKLNTFQVILVDRSDVGAGDFDIYYNYDQIQWESGSASGGVGGLGGTSAAAGYNAGLPGDPAGTYFEFPGSLVNGALLDGGPDSLVAGTNDGVAGQYLFEVRNGTVAPPPQNGVPEPAMLLLLGAGLAGFALIQRKRPLRRKA